MAAVRPATRRTATRKREPWIMAQSTPIRSNSNSKKETQGFSSDLLESFQQEVGNLAHRDIRSVGRSLLHSLETEVRKDPYRMLRYGVALGAGIVAMNARQLRSG